MWGLSAERIAIRLLTAAYLIAMYFLIADPEWTGVETTLGAVFCLAVLLRNIRIGQTPLPALFYLAVLFWFSLSLSSYFNYLSDSDPGPIGSL